MTGARALAGWLGPALVVAVVAAVAGGAASAPGLLLAAVVAPLLALLRAPRAAAPPHAVTLVLTAAVAVLLLWAHLAVLADAAVLLGARRWEAAVPAAVLALLVTLLPGAARVRAAALVLGAGVLGVALLTLAAAAGLTPAQAWRQAATRPALVFGPRSAWVTDGGRFVRAATLGFDEGHRVTAVAAGTFRVVEQDGARRVVRDWRLEAGDVLSLRPGDTLGVDAGSRLRFEAAKRVPGAAPSGSTWADAAARAPLPSALGVLATLALGAPALVPAGARRAAAAPAALLAFGLGATAWGVYAARAAPEAGLSGAAVETLLARALVPGPSTVLVVFVALGLLALFVGAADALRERVAAAAGARGPAAWTGVMVAAAAVASVAAVEPWTPLAAGLGLAGAALVAPRLADPAGTIRLGWPVQALGAVLGGAVYGALALAKLPAALAPVGAFPVLVAAPAAFAVVRALSRTTKV